MTDTRTRGLRRDLNDVVRDTHGKVMEEKVFSIIFKPFLLYVFYTHAETVLKDWTILAMFVIAFTAPELLKRFLAMKTGVVDVDQRTTTYKRESTSTSTTAEGTAP